MRKPLSAQQKQAVEAVAVDMWGSRLSGRFKSTFPPRTLCMTNSDVSKYLSEAVD